MASFAAVASFAAAVEMMMMKQEQLEVRRTARAVARHVAVSLRLVDLPSRAVNVLVVIGLSSDVSLLLFAFFDRSKKIWRDRLQ